LLEAFTKTSLASFMKPVIDLKQCADAALHHAKPWRAGKAVVALLQNRHVIG
jgi:hypothetical protein